MEVFERVSTKWIPIDGDLTIFSVWHKHHRSGLGIFLSLGIWLFLGDSEQTIDCVLCSII
jgi:hypothetical protein